MRQSVPRLADPPGPFRAELHDRLIEHPEEFAPKDLVDAFKTVADRSGYGASSKSETKVAVSFSLAAVVEEALKLERGE